LHLKLRAENYKDGENAGEKKKQAETNISQFFDPRNGFSFVRSTWNEPASASHSERCSPAPYPKPWRLHESFAHMRN
jgi:hypothetical protein